MNKFKAAYISIFLSAAIALTLTADASVTAGRLQSLVLDRNPVLKSIRDDVKRTLYTVKSRRPESELPELKFYTYRLQGKENFWIVLSKCSLDMDTLMSVNNLTSPYQVGPGTVLYIPNMRGVIVQGKEKELIKRILLEEKIETRYLKAINRTATLDKKFIFIPCGKVSKLERSLFLGTAFLSPLNGGKKTSEFGTRKDPFNSKRKEFHKGIDVACEPGTGIRASRNGRVVFSGWEEGYGNLVIIEHEFGYQSYYGHLGKFKVRAGDEVTTNQVIAFSGNTGRSTGPHLHFEIRKNGQSLNPGTFIRGQGLL
ncbi:MAG TPA: LysM peptidoglycan-binding domain-containing M23 family metallopeptidase [Spirochaetota bacterium]|nr:LysM peptidoglycan-binding domain-containing M23 family metallopeptidase [Spirochaetota bacterium]